MNKDLLFYKDTIGWSYIDQTTMTVGTFINPLPGYRIKQIYCGDYIIVWYWPKTSTIVVDQKIAIIQNHTSIDYLSAGQLMDFKKIKIMSNGILSLGGLSHNLTMGICTFSEPIDYIRQEGLVFLATKHKIIAFGDNLCQQISGWEMGFHSFSKLEFKPIVVRDIYLGDSTLFIHMIDGEIICSGSNEHGQLGIGHCQAAIQNGKVNQSPLALELPTLKLRKIICSDEFTLFWYEDGDQTKIYIAGQFYNVIQHNYAVMQNWIAETKKIYDVLVHGDTIIIVRQHKIRVHNINQHYTIKFKTKIRKVHLNELLYILDGEKLHVYDVKSLAKQITKSQNKILSGDFKPIRWFDQLPYVDSHWDIIKVIFAGHYLCPKSPLYKTKLPLDIIKLIVEFITYMAGGRRRLNARVVL